MLGVSKIDFAITTSVSSIKIAEDGSLFEIFCCPSFKPGSISIINVMDKRILTNISICHIDKEITVNNPMLLGNHRGYDATEKLVCLAFRCAGSVL
jgi:hypothetical protein